MSQFVLEGNPRIDVTLRRSARAKRISLRMSQVDGRVTLTLPRGVPEQEGLSFLHSKQNWLRSHLERRQSDITPQIGEVVPFEGTDHLLIQGQGRGVSQSDGVLKIGGPAEQAPARLQGWLKTQARHRLAAASDRYASALGRPYTRLTLRDTRSRWGSCTAEGGLMYSWRLIMAPPSVLTYVAAHEVAHLAEMNHSPAFWRVVESLYGDWRPQRDWLREHGASLHRFKF